MIRSVLVWLVTEVQWRAQLLGYWARPYDVHRDARCWRWRRRPCRHLAPDGALAAAIRQALIDREAQ